MLTQDLLGSPTTTVTAPAPVVLAVADDDVDEALRFAVAEARHHGCGVRVVAYDDDLLERVVDRVHGVPVEGQVVQGAPVRAVLDASTDAREVVVRRRDLLHLVRALTAPEQTIPTTWADPPVVCVPPDWSPVPADDRPVTLGIEETAEAAALVDRAREITGAGPLRTAHAPHARAGAVLTELAETSRLLLLGRNAVDDLGGTRLGRTAREVLHASPCPVVLLPPRHGRGAGRVVGRL